MEGSRPAEMVIPKVQRKHKPGLKTISVDEALQYTPLTTSILPVHDRLPLPQIERASDVRLTTSSERKAIHRHHYRPQDVRKKLDVLLNRDTLAEIKFKRRPLKNGAHQDNVEIEQELSPIASMVLKMTNIDYRYPSPESPEKPQSTPQVKPPQVKGSFKAQEMNRSSDRQDSPGSTITVIAKQPFQAHETRRPPGREDSPDSTIVVTTKHPFQAQDSKRPSNNDDSPDSTITMTMKQSSYKSPRKNNYVPIPASPKRRKLDEDLQVTEAALRIRTQKEVADGSLLRLQNLLLEIFEAQDSLEPDTSNAFASAENEFFDLSDRNEDSEFHLSTVTFEKIQEILKQVVAAKRIGDIPSDHIHRLQLLCEPSAESAKTIQLRFDADSSDDDEDQWCRRIHGAKNGVAAASTLIYTVLGNTDNDQLMCLETLRWLPTVLANVFETCLIPVVESRPESQSSEIYQRGCKYREELKELLESSRKLLDLVSTACVQVKGIEGFINATEFLAIKLIFVQNSYTDKGSALGSQTYERLRKQAMSALAKVYAAFPNERSAILDEILSSLDKLPSTSRSARQYKLGDGKNIQLISALFIQLVQTVSMESSENEKRPARKILQQESGVNTVFDDHDDEVAMDIDSNNHNFAQDESSLVKLRRKADHLFDNAAKVGQEIITYIVGKASKVTKTGDSPYRNVLELFLEDLLNVLSLPEWPASELLLRILAARMTDIARNEKAALSKTMALEILGTMGSAISNLKASIRTLTAGVSRDSDAMSSKLAANLLRLAEDQMLAGLRNEDLISADGPFAITISKFTLKPGAGIRAKSARAYFVAQYAKLVYLALKSHDDADNDRILDSESQNLVNAVLQQISEAASDSATSTQSKSGSNHEMQLAYVLSVLNLGFCRRFGQIVKTLASSLSSEQAQVRSRSLKSVVTMLETDPSLLDRDPTIADDVFRCASDDSALVRDSALSLIAKFIVSKPALEGKGIKRLLECAGDAKIGVQKRAIGHLKEIYLADTRPRLKSAIAQTFLRRTKDQEETVAELAKRTLTEIWITPYVTLLVKANDSAKDAVALENLTSHIVESIKADPEELGTLLKEFLTWTIKNRSANSPIDLLCGRIVNILFEATIAGSADKTSLVVLMIFSEVQPHAVAPQQLSNLRRYLSNISSEEDLFMFKSVIGIFRSVLPQLSSTHNALLKDIQDDLMKSINKLARRIEMDEVMSCLRTIDGVLHNTFRLVKLTASVMTQIINPNSNSNTRVKLLRIAGSIGKYIDLENYASQLQNDLKTFKGGSVAGFLADTIYPFTLDDQPMAVRLLGLESLGSICQSWAEQFNKKRIRGTFFSILDGHVPSTTEPQDLLKLQIVVLKVFDELYAVRAVAKNEGNKNTDEPTQIQELGKLGGSTKTRDEDSAVSLITQSVVDHVLRIALSEQGEKALLAVKNLASISHQGMIHPKQSTGAFVALETSQESEIKEMAIAAHRILHQQHESVCEREYMYAIRDAFRYQKLWNEPYGVWIPGFKPKLAPCFEIVNSSGSKYVKKFLSNMVTRINTELDKLAAEDNLIDHIFFVCFVTQNLAFFEYAKMDELLHTILQLELAFSKNGAEIVQGIETNLRLGSEIDHSAPQNEANDPYEATWGQQEFDFPLLKRLTTAATAVTLISEARSHLRRQYGISRDVKVALHQSKQAKEAAKVPLRVHGITGERFWNNSTSVLNSLDTNESMFARCRDFMALMAIDEEVKVADENDLRDSHSVSVEPEGTLQQSKKRKGTTGSTGGTPKKPRGPSLKPPRSHNRRSTSISSRDDLDGDYEL